MSILLLTAERVAQIAAERGFDVADWDENFVQKLAFVVTELDEAVQWVEGTGKDPIGVELADTAIRLMACLHQIWGKDWSPSRITHRREPRIVGLYEPIEVACWRVVRQLCKAIEAWRKNAPGQGKKDAMICVELALLETFRMADRLGINLIAEIENKTSVNKGRPKQHGLGRSVG